MCKQTKAIISETIKMCKSGVFLTVFLIVSTTILSVASAQSCNACNCQFNNVQALSQLIEVQVNRALANEPRKSHNIFQNIFHLYMIAVRLIHSTTIRSLEC